jgi:hypothetical protein
MHKDIMHDILSYFNWIDKNIFSNKAPNWLLNKNLYTLFFHNISAVEVILMQRTSMFNNLFFWLLNIPIFLICILYFQGINFYTLSIIHLETLYLYLFMFLENNIFFYNINMYLIDFINKSKFLYSLKEMYPLKYIFTYKFYFFYYLYEYKNLFYYYNCNFVKLIWYHPSYNIISIKIMSLYFMQFLCSLFIIIFINININKDLELPKVQINNKIIMFIYKHYNFIINKKKLLIIKKNNKNF